MKTTTFHSLLSPLWLLLCALALIVSPMADVVRGDDKDEEDAPPAPRNITVETKDYMRIHCTYYASKLDDAKNAIPVMMIPGWEGRRVEYDYLAKRLQSIGYACITVDLRGHGQSTSRIAPYNDPTYLKRNRIKLPSIETRTMKAADMEMMYQDIDAVKLFLREENDKQKLNLEALVVIASDFSTVLATNWVVREYAWPSYVGRRQGKNVKALVLLSPTMSAEGITCRKTMGAPAVLSQSFLLVSGAANRNANARQAIEYHNRIDTGIPDPRPDDPPALKERRLFLLQKPVEIQGTRLLDPKLGLKVDVDIAKFLDARLIKKLDQYKWSQRVPDPE